MSQDKSFSASASSSASQIIQSLREIFPQLSPEEQQELFETIEHLRFQSLLSGETTSSKKSDSIEI